MRTNPFHCLGLALLLLSFPRADGSWGDRTAGLAWLDFHSARSIGTQSTLLFVTEDKFGRLFVGSFGLVVHDGTTWKTFPAGDGAGVRSAQFDDRGRLWVGVINEFGYYDEPALGVFEYHSLLGHLPENERQVGVIWGVGVVGSRVYFMGRHKLYCWDGTRLEVLPFPGLSRLFPLTLDGEPWFHHRETGLYRLTESGPVLELDPSRLPDIGIMGIQRTPDGLLLAGDGFYLAGDSLRRVFSGEANRFIADNRLAVFANLPDGNHIAGTLNGGLIILSPTGEILRIIDQRDHPGIGVIQGILVRPDGQIWCATQDGIFRLDTSGQVTVFHGRNNLEGGVEEIDARGNELGVVSTAGTYRLVASAGHPAAFERETKLKEAYTSLRFHDDGLLLGRHGGIDHFDGHTVTPLYGLLAKGVHRIMPSRHPEGSYLLSEGDTLARLQPGKDGGFERIPIVSVPDFAIWLGEDTRGRIWVGTLSQGAFLADPASGRIEPLSDPSTGQPIKGLSCFGQNDTDLLVFVGPQVLRAETDGTNLQTLLRLPALEPTTATTLSGTRTTLLAFKRRGVSSASSWGQGLGRLTLTDDNRAVWQELDVPALESIGLVKSLACTEENGRPILWVGGSEGLLRLDLDAIPVVQAPPAPVIRLDDTISSLAVRAGGRDFPFVGHRLAFRMFPGDLARTSDWLLQTRLGQNGAGWSAATGSRTAEFSNLSEGSYRFEVRTVNAAGLASEPVVFAFRILPPWYRSKGAYTSYAVALALGIWGTMRFRERRIRALNERLEQQVQERTAQLVKANAAKDEFLAGVSHEIRNPMNGVIGLAESLPTSGLDPESRRKFGLLRECADHLSSLLEDLLDLSRMQIGVIELNVQPFDVHALVDTVAAMAAGESGKYRIPVETAVSPGVPRLLVGDARRIRQILLNFVSNALKFSGRGKVEVTVWCRPAGDEDRVEVIFAVADEGPGISPEEQARLFQRFERGAAARDGRVPGTGLGLALCKGYAEKMGGRIWLESEPGRGSCFHFSAPLGLAPAPAAGDGGDDDDDDDGAHAPPAARSALVVDDQEYNRIVLVDLLARLGIRAEATADGAEALALAGRHDFGLIFLDYDLPGLSGLEVARGIRRLPGGSAQAGIFATTAFNTPEKQRQCLEAGMNFFLGKPVTLERLRKALASAGPARPTAPVPPTAAPPPADNLANLRLLATKKQVSFEEELARYLSELQAELDELTAAVGRQQAAEAARSAHRLCGRCSFIHERRLEQVMRRLEEAVTREKWPEAARLAADLPALVADLRLRLASAGRAVPPA